MDNARRFIGALETLQGGLPDVHIGIVTTDVGTRGADDASAQPRGDCSAEGDAGVMRASRAVAGNFITDRQLGDGTRARNYTGTLGDAFVASVSDVGNTGCSVPRPLEAMRRAIESPFNAAFRREYAFLAVVFLTSRDDCSFASSTFLDGAGCDANASALIPVDDYEVFMKSLVDPQKLLVGGAFGPVMPFVIENGVVQPSCTIDARSAQPGLRLQAFLDRFVNRSIFTTLCQPDLSGVMQVAPQPWSTWFPGTCIEVPLADLDPATPGDQHDCAAWIDHRTEAQTIQEVLPACTSFPSLTTCYQIEPDPAFCPTGAGLLLHLGNPFTSPDRSSLATIECVVQ